MEYPSSFIQWVEQEHQDPDQVASVAIALFLALPDPVKLALLKGTDDVPAEQLYLWAMQELRRVITHQQFTAATQKMVETMDVSHLGSLETEDEILKAAVKLTRQQP